MQHFSYIELGWKTETLFFCSLPSTGISFSLLFWDLRNNIWVHLSVSFMYNQDERPLFWHYKHLNMLRKSFLRVCHKPELRSLTSFLVWFSLKALVLHAFNEAYIYHRESLPSSPFTGLRLVTACHLSLHCSCYLLHLRTVVTMHCHGVTLLLIPQLNLPLAWVNDMVLWIHDLLTDLF